MPSIPQALLSKLYVSGSLSNTENGFEFDLRNHLGPSILTGVGPLQVDGQEVDPKSVQVRMERPAGKRGRQPEPLIRSAKTIDPAKAVRFDLDTTLRVIVTGRWLAAGEHRCILQLQTREVGTLVVEITGEVADRRGSNGKVG